MGDDDSDDAVDEVLGRLRGLVREAKAEGLSVHECFDHFDRDGSGDIDEDEFKRGLKKLGISVRSSEVRLLSKRFAARRSGRVKYRDFARAVAPSSRHKSPKRSPS